jgi:putative tryptophan/tyrosine transport system substrate-binding protein
MNRRAVISMLGSAAVAPALLAPRSARAQQQTLPLVGFLTSRSPGESAHLIAAFRQGLSETGHVEGKSIQIAYRFGEGDFARLPALAADLVERKPAVIVAVGPGALAIKAATSTIPVVFISGNDPVEAGLVASLNRPGGNVTGVGWFSSELGAKRLGLLHELVPNAAVFALLMNSRDSGAARQSADVAAGVRALGRALHVVDGGSATEIDAAFATLAQRRPDALIVAGDPFFTSRREQLVALAARHAAPAIYPAREFVEGGGLLSYGNNNADAYRRAAAYAGRILNGAKPGELPVERQTKFELTINLKTAKSLGLSVPPTLLATADEVVE